MATRGRPTKWTVYEHYRLWVFVTYKARRLGINAACQHLSRLEPWRNTRVSAATLRRRFNGASHLRVEGKLGRDDWWKGPIDFNFALSLEDLRAMWGRDAYRQAMEEYAAEERATVPE